MHETEVDDVRNGKLLGILFMANLERLQVGDMVVMRINGERNRIPSFMASSMDTHLKCQHFQLFFWWRFVYT